MIVHPSKAKANTSLNDRFADAMLGFGFGISIFYWFFSSLLRFIDSPNSDWQLIVFGTELQFYEKLAVSVLFIVFGSHVQMNIKKRRQAEEDLSESEEKYKSILESIEEGYYEVNLNGDFTFLNNSMCTILARGKDEILSTNILDYVEKKYDRIFRETFKDVKENKILSTPLECELYMKSGGNKVIDMSASLIKDSSSKGTGIRGIARDITEKRLLEKSLLESLEKNEEAKTGVILGLAKLAEYRDNDTGKHLERIREFSRVLAEELKSLPQYNDYITESYIDDIYQSSILHDIGKVGVPDHILLKPGKLTEEEFEYVKMHPTIGGEALSAIDKHFTEQSFLTIGKEIAYHHHEKWNGKGYPDNLAGEQIPLSARIVSLADVYDALTSKRCYKDAFSHEKAKDIILSDKGVAFDPAVVDAFLKLEGTFIRIRQELHEEPVQ
jgi:PAS domain S-box-containing protein